MKRIKILPNKEEFICQDSVSRKKPVPPTSALKVERQEANLQTHAEIVSAQVMFAQ